MLNDWDVDRKDLLKNDTTYLSCEAKNLILEVQGVKSLPDTGKPGVNVTFIIKDGPYTTQLISNRYWNTPKAVWRMRRLALACGLFELGTTFDEQGNEVQCKKIGDNFVPGMLVGQRLIADSEKSQGEDKVFYNITNERPIDTKPVSDLDGDIKPSEDLPF